MRLSQPSVTAKFRKIRLLFTSWIHFVHLVNLAYRFVNWKWNIATVTEGDRFIIIRRSMTNGKAMREMGTSEDFSVLKMEFIRFTSS